MTVEEHPESPSLRTAEAGLGAKGSRPFIVAIRIGLLLLASVAMALGWAIALRDRSTAGTSYVCPMHLEVVAREPGTCPICRMALEKVDSAMAPPAGALGPSMNGEVEAVENVRKHNVIDFVRRRSLLPHTRELRGGAWIEDDGSVSAVLYRDQADVIAAGEQGTFSLTRAPSVAVPVRRTSDAPVVWDASTVRIRFRPEPIGARPSPLHAGDVGWLEVAPKPRDVLAVPVSAVLQSPEGPYVLAWTGTGYTFDKRSVEIGEIFAKSGFAVVLSGLRANERVVARATFFLDAERRMASRMNEGGVAAR